MPRVGLLTTAMVVLVTAGLAASWVQQGSGARPNPAPTAPLSGLPEAPVGELSVLGRAVTRIADGDFVHPAFSLDGRKIAYSRVVVMNGTELTEVLVRDLGSNQVVTLLDAGASKKYAVYKSFVSGLHWTGHSTLEAELEDGDVGTTRLVLDTAAGKVLSETHSEGGEEAFTLTAEEQSRLKKALAALPDWRRPALEGALRDGVPAGENVLIIQKRYFGEDAHIWRLDLERKEVRRLLELPPRGYEMRGGFAHGDTVILLLARNLPPALTKAPAAGDNKAWLLALRGEHWARLAEIEAGWHPVLEVKHSSPAGVWFRVQSWWSYERGNNPLFVFDAHGVRRVSDVTELYDATVDSAGRQICLVAWEGSERHLLLGSLPSP